MMSSAHSFESTVGKLMPYIEPSVQTRTYVDMDQTAIAHLPPGSKNQLLLYTDGLVGCTATALIGTYQDGAKVGYLQHYQPAGLINDRLKSIMLYVWHTSRTLLYKQDSSTPQT